MGAYRFSILLDATPERVFEAWTDLARMPQWVGGVTGVTNVTGPIDQAGTRYVVEFGRMRSPTVILEVARPHHIRTRFGTAILKGESNVSIEPHGAGTRLTQELHTHGAISAIFARLFATGSWSGSFRGELEAFRRLVESDAADEPNRTD